MSEEKGLVQFEEKTVLQCFTTGDGLDPLVAQVKELVDSFEHDLSTATGRKKTASLSAKVSRFKVQIDDLGKDLVSDWKQKSKKVDAARKKFRDAVDELRDEARKPLTDWEAEQKRIEAEEAERKAAEELAKEFATDHEIALILDREHDRIKEDERKEQERVKAEQEAEEKRKQEEREKAIAEKVKADAEAREKAAIEAKEKAEREAIIAAELAKKQAEQAERDKIAAAAKAEQDRIAAEAKAKADAEASAEAARLAEIARQEAEAKRIEDEKAALERNRAHVGKIRKAAKEHLMLVDGVSEDIAKAIVLHLTKNKIQEITVNYS